MHLSLIDILAAGAGLTAVWMCGISHVQSSLRMLALQTLLLAAITGIIGAEHHAVQYLVLASVVLVVKAITIPAYLSWAARRVNIRQDTGVLLHPIMSLLCGFAILIIGLSLAPQIAVPSLGTPGAAGMALACVFIGMLVMITRRLALSQLAGFLVLENGIFLYGLTQTHGMPLIIEMGVVFDILVGVMVAGVVIFRLNRSFEHIDVTQLRGLRH